MVFTKYNNTLPDWVKQHIMMDCPYCGSMIVDNSDGPNGMTARYCPNPRCPGHMQYKMDAMAKRLGVKNFGPATALTYIKIHHCETHLEILDDWLQGNKPTMKLSDIAEIACLDGYSEVTGRKELNEFCSFTDYFKNAKGVNQVLWKNRDVLLKAESYFTVAPPLAKRKIYVMGHGSFDNFSSREEFFNQVNDAFGNIVQVIEVGKRKTSVHFLIMDKSSSHSGGKYTVAVENGIPIVTPLEFVNILDGYTHT